MSELHIEGPTASCGHCRFLSALSGTWSVEAGVLVWRSNPDVLPNRGPSLFSCCESDPVVDFDTITVDGRKLKAWHVSDMRRRNANNEPGDGTR
jgi:hypothetical protein